MKELALVSVISIFSFSGASEDICLTW